MKRKVILHVVLVLLGATNGYGQTADDLIAIAIKENLELKVLENEYLAANEIGPQVGQLPDTEFGLGLYPLPVATRLGSQLVRLSVTQMLPWFGTLESKEDLEMAKAKTLYERIGIKALDLKFLIKRSFYQLYEIEQSQSIIEESMVILAALQNLARAKVESGKGSTADVLRVQLKEEELRQKMQILQASETKPTVAINQLLNRELVTEIPISPGLTFATMPVNKDSLLIRLSDNHPLLRMLSLQQEVSQKKITLNELDSKPTFGVGLDYLMVDARSDAEPRHNGRDILQLRGVIRVPISQGKYSAKQREEDYRIVALDHSKANTLSQFRSAIEQAYADHEEARLKIELYERQIEITSAAIRILEGEYSTQGNNFDELLRLEQELIDYDLKLLYAIVASHQAKNRVERYLNL